MKHVVLGNYIRLFVNKLGSTYATVHYLDGYAGPGVYGDGNPGSPLLAAQVADLVKEIRTLRCTFVERDPEFCQTLREVLAEAMPTAEVICDSVGNRITELLNSCEGSPLLAFLDPFGLAIEFQQLEALAQRRAPTDIIMNVSLSALRRNAGHLTSTSTNPAYLKARETIIARMDAVLGGDWWRPIWQEAHDSGSDEGAGRIAIEFAKRCKDLRGGYFLAAVRDRWDGPPAYLVLLLSSHRDAHWNFNEFMSSAHDALRAADPSVPNDDTLLVKPADEYAAVIEANLRRRVEKGSFVIDQQMTAVYGSVLAQARGKHLRPVIKKLCKDEVIEAVDPKGKEDGVGDLQKMRIRKKRSPDD